MIIIFSIVEQCTNVRLVCHSVRFAIRAYETVLDRGQFRKTLTPAGLQEIHVFLRDFVLLCVRQQIQMYIFPFAKRI